MTLRQEVEKIIKEKFGELASNLPTNGCAVAIEELFEKWKQDDEVQKYIEACIDAKFKQRIDEIVSNERWRLCQILLNACQLEKRVEG